MFYLQVDTLSVKFYLQVGQLSVRFYFRVKWFKDIFIFYVRVGELVLEEIYSNSTLGCTMRSLVKATFEFFI